MAFWHFSGNLGDAVILLLAGAGGLLGAGLVGGKALFELAAGRGVGRWGIGRRLRRWRFCLW